MRSYNRDEAGETPILHSRMLQPVNTITASNSRPNSMGHGSLSSRPMSKATDQLYEIQPIKISVKKDSKTDNLSLKSRSKSNPPVHTNVNRKNSGGDNNHDIDQKYVGHVKWQIDEYHHAYNSMDNFNKISETQDELVPNECTHLLDSHDANENENRVVTSTSTG